jgi:DNA repair photolyase
MSTDGRILTEQTSLIGSKMERCSGKKVLGTYLYSLAWTSQFYFCAFPLRLDSYKSCNFDCKYCFVSHRGGNYRKDSSAVADVAKFKRYLQYSAKSESEAKSLLSECIMHRLPIHFGGMSEPFRHGEVSERVTYHLLLALAEADYPTLVSTKSSLPAMEPYFSLLKSMRYIAVQFSFSTLDDEIASKIEPYAPLPSSRLRAMYKLAQAGLWVSCRLQPLIPNVSGDLPTLVKELAAVGARHITVEHLKLGLRGSRSMLRELQQHCSRAFDEGYNLSKLQLKGTEYELIPAHKISALQSLREETIKYGITLGVGDNDFHDLGDNPNCCGIGRLPGFENYFRHQITYAIWRRSKDGFITYSSIEREWAPRRSIRRYLNSKCRNGDGPDHLCYTADDYLRQKWNSLDALHGPTECSNVISAGFRDNHGNLVYKYEPICDLVNGQYTRRA